MDITPKEKAQDLVYGFINYFEGDYNKRKQQSVNCALETVGEIINLNEIKTSDQLKYWHEVKNELLIMANL